MVAHNFSGIALLDPGLDTDIQIFSGADCPKCSERAQNALSSNWRHRHTLLGANCAALLPEDSRYALGSGWDWGEAYFETINFRESSLSIK